MSHAMTFREAYAVLQRHAQTLRTQQEPDIDNLTTIVRESLDAYKVCKERIDAVEKALAESLGDADLGSVDDAQLEPPRALPGAAVDADTDDETPF